MKFELPQQEQTSRTPFLIRFTRQISGGLLRNDAQAAGVLFVVAGTGILLSLLWIYSILKGPDIPPEALENPDYGYYVED